MSDEKQNHIDGVDFYAAIQAHVLWRVRLEAYINGTGGEKLNADLVSHDHNCALGEWIHGPGGKVYGTHPRFPELQEAHACFHRQAGEVIRCADSGEGDKARELLRGNYSACSQKVKANLAKLGLEAAKS